MEGDLAAHNDSGAHLLLALPALALGGGIRHTGGMDATAVTRPAPGRWPAALTRWGVTPVVAGLWAGHTSIVALAAAVPVPPGPGPAVGGVPWLRWDVGWYMAIAAHGYAHLPTYYAAYFPGVPAYLWLMHWPLVALLGMQVVFLLLLAHVGRLAAAWGLAGWRVTLAQALVAFSPAAIFYSTAYPEAWEALGLCGALLAMKAGRPARAAAWSALAGIMDPLGMLIGVGAGVWAGWGLIRREWPALRPGVTWGLGSVAALAVVSGTLVANGQRAFGFIGAQRAWGAHWLLPGVQVWQALTRSSGPELDTSVMALAMFPVVLAGLIAMMRAIRRSIWHASALGVSAALVGVALAFFTNREPLASAGRFLSLAIPAAVAVAGILPRRAVIPVVAWYSLWAIAGAILFTHGWFWG